MWSAAVFEPAFPGRSSTASGSPVPVGAVVDERPQRVVAEPALERRRRALLLRVRGDQGGVHVDDQRLPGVDAVVGGVLAGQRPRPRPGRGPGRVDRGQRRGGVGGERGRSCGTPSGPRRPGRTRRARRAAPRCRPGSPRPPPASPPDPAAILAGSCTASRLPPRRQRRRQRAVQPDRADGLGQQHPTGLRHDLPDPAVSTPDRDRTRYACFT